MAEVARLYYVRDLTQQQIAKRLGVSRFKVLRLLEQARAEGVVRFEIDEPVPVLDDLSAELEQRFGLETALVVEDDVARAAAHLLPGLLRPRDVLGVAWGRRLQLVVEQLPMLAEARMPVVQICGAIAGLVPGTGPTEVAARFAERTRRAVSSAAGARASSRRAATCASNAPFEPTSKIFDERHARARRHRRTARRRRAHARPRLRRRRAHLHKPKLARRSCRSRNSAARRSSRSPAAAKASRRAGALHTGLLDVLVTDARLREVRAAMKTAVVTGSAGGIGSATVVAFEKAGFTVHGVDRRRPVPGARPARRSRLRARDQRPAPRRRPGRRRAPTRPGTPCSTRT